MKAIQLTGPRRLQLTEAPVPEPEGGEVLVELEAQLCRARAAEEDHSRAKQQNQNVMLTVSHRWNLGY